MQYELGAVKILLPWPFKNSKQSIKPCMRL